MVRFAQFVFAWLILSSLCNAQEIVNVRGQLFRKVCHGTHCTLERIADVIAPNRQVISPEPMIPDPVPAEPISVNVETSLLDVIPYQSSAIPSPINAPNGLCDEQPFVSRRPIKRVMQSRPVARVLGWLFR